MTSLPIDPPVFAHTCFFCQQSKGNFTSLMHFYCDSCPTNYQLSAVISTYDTIDETKILYVHLHLGDPPVYVRLHLEENKTIVWTTGFDVEMVGFPITIHNVRKKIRTYLTFS
jgi:hypothetical protein